MLSFVSSTTLTVLTTTISMRLIVLQVASGNFSHQLLRDYIQSRADRGILAVYVGAVAYSITLQRSMDADAEFVPQLAMTVAMLLIAMSLATFIWYVSRVVDMVRVDAIIDGTVRQTVANIDERIRVADCPLHEPRPLVPGGAEKKPPMRRSPGVPPPGARRRADVDQSRPRVRPVLRRRRRRAVGAVPRCRDRHRRPPGRPDHPGAGPGAVVAGGWVRVLRVGSAAGR